VFTKPEVTKRVAKEFVPVALKAALVNDPPDDDEGRLYAGIGRSKPAPQGICATDGHGRVLVWTLGFDEAASIPEFLDHVLVLYKAHRDDLAPFAAERWRTYPGNRLPDMPADASEGSASREVPSSHPAGHACNGLPRVPAGTLIARVVGRALSADGTPVSDTDAQERYVEDSFEIPPVAQAELAAAAASAGAERFRVPAAFSRWWVEHAYLGQLDVKPSRMDRLDLFAKRTGDGLLRIEGDTEASGGDGTSPRGDGAVHIHAIRLAWEGFAKIEGRSVIDLVLLAQGTERVRWGNVRREGKATGPDVAHLMAGKAYDQDGGVRYGIVASPASAERTCNPGEEPVVTTGGPPASLQRKLQRLQALMRILAPDVAQPIAATLQGIDPLAQAGRFAEVEALVDRALARAEAAAPAAGTDRVRIRLERLHDAVRRLVEAGKTDEALALLDRALKSFEDDDGAKKDR
jgi:hypothetical protein